MKSHSQGIHTHGAPTKHWNAAHQSLGRIPLIGMGLLFPYLHRRKGFSKVLNLTSVLLCSHCGARGGARGDNGEPPGDLCPPGALLEVRSGTLCHWWLKELSPSTSGGDAGLN